MRYEIIPVTPFAQNCTLFWCDQTAEAVLIDPGGDVAKVSFAIKQTGVKLQKILLTHGHIDHVGAAARLSIDYQVPIVGPHIEDKFWLDQLPEQGRHFGLPACESFEPNQWLKTGDVVSFGRCRLEVFHTPGHTPGHVVYFERTAQIVQVGDVLFAGSVGRSDFPRSNPAELKHSIFDTLLPLGDAVRFISGHGPMSTLGREKQTNPFLL